MSNATVDVTYNPDATEFTDVGKLRLAIGDTDPMAGARPGGANYSDSELSTMITAAGGWAKAVPLMLRSLAAEYNRTAQTAFTAGAEDSAKSAVATAAEYRAQAAAWEKRVDEGLDESAAAETLVADSVQLGYSGTPFFELPPRDLR